MAKRRFHDSLWKPAGQAINEHQMIQEGDQIAVGVSGGKDSMTLLYVLNEMRKFSPVKFHLHAISIDLGFDISLIPVGDFCRDIGVSWSQVHTKIAPSSLTTAKNPNPVHSAARCAMARYISQPNRWAAARSPWLTAWMMP